MGLCATGGVGISSGSSTAKSSTSIFSLFEGDAAGWTGTRDGVATFEDSGPVLLERVDVCLCPVSSEIEGYLGDVIAGDVAK